MRFECRSLGVRMGVLGWGRRCVWGVRGWVSEFQTSGIVYMLIHTISMRIVCACLIWPKSGLSELGKKTLFNSLDFLLGLCYSESDLNLAPSDGARLSNKLYTAGKWYQRPSPTIASLFSIM